MKSAFSFIASLLFVLCVAQVSAYAQEGPDNEHPTYEDKAHHDTPIGDTENDPEVKVLTPSSKSIGRDSSATRTTAPRVVKSNQEPAKEAKPQQGQPPAGVEDDSILSFNFIYYIIQKFKLQDIIE